MKTFYSEIHKLRDANTELYGGELVKPFESQENRWTLSNYYQVLSADPPLWKYILNTQFFSNFKGNMYFDNDPRSVHKNIMDT